MKREGPELTERLRYVVALMQSKGTSFQDEKFKALIEGLIKALEFYANPFTYEESSNAMLNIVPDEDVDFTGKTCPEKYGSKETMWSTRNAGIRARAAIKEFESEIENLIISIERRK